MCDCITEVNAKLAESNGEMLTTLWPVVRPLMETQKLEPRKRVKPPLVVATFCPFCGEKYAAALEKM